MTSNNDAARERAARAEEQEEQQPESPESDMTPLSTLAEGDDVLSGFLADTSLDDFVGVAPEDIHSNKTTEIVTRGLYGDAVAHAVTNDVQPTTRQSINKVQQLVTAMHRNQGEIDVLKSDTRRILAKLMAE